MSCAARFSRPITLSPVPACRPSLLDSCPQDPKAWIKEGLKIRKENISKKTQRTVNIMKSARYVRK